MGSHLSRSLQEGGEGDSCLHPLPLSFTGVLQVGCDLSTWEHVHTSLLLLLGAQVGKNPIVPLEK